MPEGDPPTHHLEVLPQDPLPPPPTHHLEGLLQDPLLLTGPLRLVGAGHHRRVVENQAHFQANSKAKLRNFFQVRSPSQKVHILNTSTQKATQKRSTAQRNTHIMVISKFIFTIFDAPVFLVCFYLIFISLRIPLQM